MGEKGVSSLIVIVIMVVVIVAATICGYIILRRGFHRPIWVYGNDGFTSANGVVAGSGTVNDPYVIANWNINAKNTYGIEIAYTTAYFIIRNCYVHDGGGILFVNVKNGTVENNMVKNNGHGIWLDYFSSNNTIANNTFSNNGQGIYLSSSDSDNNIISGNTVKNNGSGIYFDSNNNIISGNNVESNQYGIYFYSSNNIISGNTVKNNQYGIYEYNPLPYASSNNLIENNLVENNGDLAIYFMNSQNNLISSNVIKNNYQGIYLAYSKTNLIENNTVVSNQYGVYLRDSSNNNQIYHNNFIKNSTQAYDNGSNYWDNGFLSGGNYWSDHPPIGFETTPYYIPGDNNSDRWPLIYPWTAANNEQNKDLDSENRRENRLNS
jgi:parallel beta-helix repeat protein